MSPHYSTPSSSVQTYSSSPFYTPPPTPTQTNQKFQLFHSHTKSESPVTQSHWSSLWLAHGSSQSPSSRHQPLRWFPLFVPPLLLCPQSGLQSWQLPSLLRLAIRQPVPKILPRHQMPRRHYPSRVKLSLLLLLRFLLLLAISNWKCLVPNSCHTIIVWSHHCSMTIAFVCAYFCISVVVNFAVDLWLFASLV